MKKFKLFIENFLVYGIGGIISKIIPLIMIPFITRIMPNSTYYGISDLSNTIISFCSALAVMGMYDAMFRMFFEKEDELYQMEICSTTLIFTLGTSLIVFFLTITCKNMISRYIFGNSEIDYLVYICALATLVSATNSIISAPTRMKNKRKVFLIMNLISPLLSYTIAIPLLLAGHYLTALPLAAVMSGIISEITFFILNKQWYSFKMFRKEYIKPLLNIAIPLLPNFLIYWIFNSCDKVMIVNLLNAGASGIYSVGSKLGNCSQLIYTAFAGGWQFFAFSTMNDNNQVKNNSLVFEYLGVISYICSFYVFAWAETIYNKLFSGEYINGFIVSPYLFLAPLLQMLFQVASNQFLVVKKTWPNLPILLSGAIINIILNILLIPRLGIEGAAISTLIGYTVTDIICVLVLYKMKLHVITNKFIISTIIMFVFILIWRFVTIQSVVYSTVLSIICTMSIVFLYKTDLMVLFGRKVS